ncbi:signal peptidase I [Amedibacillus sp. YH-ame10]
MRLLKKITHLIFLLAIVSLVTFIISMQLHPKETADFIGFRMYSVLTNSMEPRIPTNSLVFTKVVDVKDNLDLKKGDIITFNANRFGEEILITHHFNKMEQNDKGEWCYRTNPESSDELDVYETKREDIIGTYVFHIPYVGKLVLFLQSKFGFLMYAELFVVWCVNKLIKARWEEKDKEKKNNKKKNIVNTSKEKEEIETKDIHKEEQIEEQ